MFAVSMKLPPASLNASYIRRDSSLDAPQPRSSPKVMVPRHNSETRNPLWPNSLYRMDGSLLQMLQGLDDSMRYVLRELCHRLRHGVEEGLLQLGWIPDRVS